MTDHIYSAFDRSKQSQRARFEEISKIWNQLLIATNADIDRATRWLEQLDRRYKFFDPSFTLQDFLKQLERCAEHFRKRPEPDKESLCDRLGVDPWNKAEKQQLQQLVILEPVCADGEETLAQSIPMAQVMRLFGPRRPRGLQGVLVEGSPFVPVTLIHKAAVPALPACVLPAPSTTTETARADPVRLATG